VVGGTERELRHRLEAEGGGRCCRGRALGGGRDPARAAVLA
jgi:hypothetical protein